MRGRVGRKKKNVEEMGMVTNGEGNERERE